MGNLTEMRSSRKEDVGVLYSAKYRRGCQPSRPQTLSGSQRASVHKGEEAVVPADSLTDQSGLKTARQHTAQACGVGRVKTETAKSNGHATRLLGKSVQLTLEKSSTRKAQESVEKMLRNKSAKKLSAAAQKMSHPVSAARVQVYDNVFPRSEHVISEVDTISKSKDSASEKTVASDKGKLVLATDFEDTEILKAANAEMKSVADGRSGISGSPAVDLQGSTFLTGGGMAVDDDSPVGYVLGSVPALKGSFTPASNNLGLGGPRRSANSDFNPTAVWMSDSLNSSLDSGTGSVGSGLDLASMNTAVTLLSSGSKGSQSSTSTISATCKFSDTTEVFERDLSLKLQCVIMYLFMTLYILNIITSLCVYVTSFFYLKGT